MNEMTPYGNHEPVMSGNSALAIANTQKAIAEVQAAMMIARSCPRNEIAAIDRIKKAFSRPGLALRATYSYPRGGQQVVGPSIRTAEAIAQSWGNIQFGFREIDRGFANGYGYSEVEAFAWDVETNAKRCLQFRVAHKRDTKNGSKPLTDERDVYEMVANQSQRRVRACILAIIPGDVVEDALAVAEKAAMSNVDMSREAMTKLLDTFAGKGVSKQRIELYFGRKFESIGPGEVVMLRRIYQSIRDGIGKPDDYFPPEEKQENEKTETLKDKIKAKRETESIDPETGEVIHKKPEETLTFAEVADRLGKAKTPDDLDLAADDIRRVPGEKFQEELRVMYESAKAQSQDR